MNEAPVLIVGGGPVGLALALGLARQNVHSTLFETKSKIDSHSRHWESSRELWRYFVAGIFTTIIAAVQLSRWI
jgi:2-polyprenyl-6-methoxyphenol hydroxylase-like FAD-dependent oxidoreductase